MKNNTINKKEIEKFSKIAEEWWNPEGKFKPLHKFNPIRISYIKENIIKTFKLDHKKAPLKNIKILDLGCGSGEVTLALAKLGFQGDALDNSKGMMDICKKKLSIPKRLNNLAGQSNGIYATATINIFCFSIF